MPTLFRLLVLLLILAGLAYATMFALVAFVEPEQELVTRPIPSRDLLPQDNAGPAIPPPLVQTPTTPAEGGATPAQPAPAAP